MWGVNFACSYHGRMTDARRSSTLRLRILYLLFSILLFYQLILQVGRCKRPIGGVERTQRNTLCTQVTAPEQPPINDLHQLLAAGKPRQLDTLALSKSSGGAMGCDLRLQ
jgi:hypothetical protein